MLKCGTKTNCSSRGTDVTTSDDLSRQGGWASSRTLLLPQEQGTPQPPTPGLETCGVHWHTWCV